MQNPLKRLRNLWRLSDVVEANPNGVSIRINTAVDPTLQLFKEATGLKNVVRIEEEVESTEKGEFLPDMTDDEVLEYERKERLGWKNFKLPWKKDETKTD